MEQTFNSNADDEVIISKETTRRESIHEMENEFFEKTGAAPQNHDWADTPLFKEVVLKWTEIDALEDTQMHRVMMQDCTSKAALEELFKSLKAEEMDHREITYII